MAELVDVLAPAARRPLPERPGCGVERAFGKLLAELLSSDQVTPDSHFFDDLGADSLVMAHFCARVRKRPDLPSVSMKDIYQHPTVTGLAAALTRTAARPVAASAPWSAPEAAASPTPAPLGSGAQRRCAALQSLIFLGYAYLTASILTVGIEWTTTAATLPEIYLRSVGFGSAMFVVLSALPILTKWLLVGRWTPRELPIWSLSYVRFWAVKTLIRSNPLVLFAGSPLYAWYLRALGVRVGRDAVILSRIPPVGSDLISIGDRAVIRPDAVITGYRAHQGMIQIGGVDIGADAMVGEATVLDIDTAVGTGAQLGRSSALHRGQSVPAGERWHGSPAQPTATDYRAGHQARCGRLRKVTYTAAQLVSLVFVYLPLGLGGITLLLTEVPQLSALLRAEETAMSSWTFYRDALVAAAALVAGAALIGLLVIAIVPRLLNLAITPERVYPLYGVHYGLHRSITRLTNVKFFTRVFGDSSYIIGYLRLLGYELKRVVQTGSNFGTDIRQGTPYLSSVGSGTMVADGLSIVNADYSSSSFRISRVTIGAHNFLGNRIVYPAQGRTGDNCLLATKVLIPVDGPVREGVGLLGSPPFEIPRTVERDSRVDEGKDAAELRRGLAAKNRHNLATIAQFLIVRWLYVFVMLVSTGVALDLYDRWGEVAIALNLALTPVVTVVFFVLVERLLTARHRLRPLYCSIYDRDFWRRERYWKIPAEQYVQVFNGTPFKPMVWRLLGARMGRRVFDDGCFITERAMASIGDDCTLNAGSVVQCHSQEDGAFKSDTSVLGARGTLGVGAFVHYGVTLGEGAVLAPDSFLMKGEDVPAHAKWGGNPARPLTVDTRSPATLRLAPSPRSWPAPAPRPAEPDRTQWYRPAAAALVIIGLATLVWTPQIMPDLWTDLRGQLDQIGAAWRAADSALVLRAATQAFLLVLPALAVGAVAFALCLTALRRVHPAPPEPVDAGAETSTVEVHRVVAIPRPRPSVENTVVLEPTRRARPTPRPRPVATPSPAPAAIAPALPVPDPVVMAPPAPTAPDLASPAESSATPPTAGSAAGPAARRRHPAGGATAVLLTVASLVVGLGLLGVPELAARAATAGEAALAAGAALHPGSPLAPLSVPDTITAAQIAVLNVLVAAAGPGGVLADARTSLLLVSLLGSLLLWPVTRRMMVSPPGAALAVALSGLLAPALTGLPGTVDPGVLGALWLTVAAALVWRSRGATVAALAAAVIAVLTVPLAAVGPLALVAHGLLGGVFTAGRRWVVAVPLGVACAAAAAGVAGWSTGLVTTGLVATGAGPWAGGPAQPGVLVGTLAAGAAVLLLTWFGTPSLRPVASAAAAWLACAAVPGPQATTALLLAVPVLAVLTATVLDDLLDRAQRSRRALLGAVVVAAAVNAGPLVLDPPGHTAPAPDGTRLGAWIEAELDPAVALRVDPLTGAQLIRDGIAAQRLVPATAPAPAGALSVVAAGSSGSPPPGRALVTVPDGPGGPLSVISAEAGPDDAAQRLVLESRLAGNPALSLAPPAAAALRTGTVDLRLATALSGLTAGHRLTVAEFAAVPGEPADTPHRTVVITEVDGAAAAEPGVTDQVRRWLDGQRAPFRPARITVERNALVVHYTAIPPER